MILSIVLDVSTDDSYYVIGNTLFFILAHFRFLNSPIWQSILHRKFVFSTTENGSPLIDFNVKKMLHFKFQNWLNVQISPLIKKIVFQFTDGYSLADEN